MNFSTKLNFVLFSKAIYIRLADKSRVDGNTVLGDGGLCHYVDYERLGDFSNSSHDSCQSYYYARPPSDECRAISPHVMGTSHQPT